MLCHVYMCYVYAPISHSILRNGVDVKSLTCHEKHDYLHFCMTHDEIQITYTEYNWIGPIYM